jgi:hypothetical protein
MTDEANQDKQSNKPATEEPASAAATAPGPEAKPADGTVAETPAEPVPEAVAAGDANKVSPEQFQLEQKRIELEIYKAKLDFRKFVWVSGFAAIVIAALPPAFQYATAHLEHVKSEQQMLLDQKNKDADMVEKQEEFRQGYIKDFLTNALNQDIELRIRFAQYFAYVSGEKFKKDWVDYYNTVQHYRDDIRSKIDTLETEWYQKAQTAKQGDPELERLTRNLNWAYKEVGYVERDRSVTANPRAPDNPAPSALLTGSTSVLDTVRNVRDTAPCLAVAGVRYVGRYYGGTEWRRMSVDEAAALNANGIRLVALYELPANAINADSGKKSAQEAISYARDFIRQPFGTVIFFNIDFDASDEDIQGRVLPYFQAINEVIRAAPEASRYRIGAYGSGSVLERLRSGKLIDMGWLAPADGEVHRKPARTEAGTFCRMRQLIQHCATCLGGGVRSGKA